jgi:hypothetical protein
MKDITEKVQEEVLEEEYPKLILIEDLGMMYATEKSNKKTRFGIYKCGFCGPKSCSFHCIKTCDYTKSPYCIIKALYNAAKGNMKKGYAFAGSNAFLAEKISSVKEVMSTLEREFFLATHKLA